MDHDGGALARPDCGFISGIFPFFSIFPMGMQQEVGCFAKQEEEPLSELDHFGKLLELWVKTKTKKPFQC